jgi:Asp-tRNA(Asn)/Glu-tRNA(Gln) amidotransferase A subunit family amidase
MRTLIRHRALAAEAAELRAGRREVAAEAAETCDRIEEVDPALAAFVPESGRRDRLATEATSTVRRWTDPRSRPALYGVPVGVKDIMRVDGLPTRAGSVVPPELLDGPQATVVDRLRAAGALVAGKTVTAEFAFLAPGPTRNPHNLAHTPGGSSSGSAAAVAAGLVPLAIGTQTVGSVIRPAAFCGVVGFKPSYGRIPTDGVIANAPSLDTVGLFAADVAGVALAASVLCDGWQVAGPPSALPVLGIPTGPYLSHAGPEASATFAANTQQLRTAGYQVREVPVMADFDDIARQLYVINRYEIAQVHAEWFVAYGGLYREETAAAIREGQAIEPAEYQEMRRGQGWFREQLASAMAGAGIDIWIAPPTTGPAPEGLSSTGDSVMCLPWNHAGLPALTVPAGFAANGLPLGLQCVAGSGQDERLLAWAAAIWSAGFGYPDSARWSPS